MAKGSMNSTLLYVGIAVAAVAVLALVYYGSPGAAMKSIGLEGFSKHDKKEEGFADEDEEQFATMEDDADEDAIRGKINKVPANTCINCHNPHVSHDEYK